MAEVFLISDTHFGHTKILDFVPARAENLGKTVEEHNEALVERWNAVIRSRDTVWHLGDVLFGQNNFSILGRLNGIKKLVLGNHDTYNASRYLQYFNDVKGAAKLDDFLLTHIPVHPSQKYRWRGNIHGHMHEKVLDDTFYFNVSCEQVNFQPFPFYQIKRAYEQREA